MTLQESAVGWCFADIISPNVFGTRKDERCTRLTDFARCSSQIFKNRVKVTVEVRVISRESTLKYFPRRETRRSFAILSRRSVRRGA